MVVSNQLHACGQIMQVLASFSYVFVSIRVFSLALLVFALQLYVRKKYQASSHVCQKCPVLICPSLSQS